MQCRFGWTNRVALLPVALVALFASVGCSTTARITTSVTQIFSSSGEKTKERKVKGKDPTKHLVFRMEVTPKEVSLSDTRRLKLHITLENDGKRFTQLHFPTTQRIEILVRDSHDHLVTQWSEDRAYDQVPGYVGINPGERVSYNTEISTRDLQAGKTYKILAFLPNYDHLRAEKQITPKP